MHLFYRSLLCCLLSAGLLPVVANSQPIQPRLRWQEGDPVIKAVLVRIWTYAGRVHLLAGSTDADGLYLSNELRKDVDTVSKLVRRDWSSNFDYKPVYFFVDTAIEAVLAGRFTGVLLDENMQPVADPVISDGDTAFFIASSDPWLTVYDHRLSVLPSRFPANHRDDGAFFKRKKLPYKYNSKAFRFGYRGVAGNYSSAVRKFYKSYQPPSPAAD